MEVSEYIDKKLTHSLHTSERLSFRGCRRRWSWLFRDGWYPQTTAKPLEFGAAFHKGMEALYDPMTWGKDPEAREALAILAFTNETNAQRNAFLKLNDGQIDPEAEQDYNERVELGVGMIRYHHNNVSPKLDGNLKPIRVEIEFEVPIQGPDGEQLWCKCQHCRTRWKNSPAGIAWHDRWQRSFTEQLVQGGMPRGEAIKYTNSKGRWIDHWKGLPVTYGGRIDCLMEDEYGRLWIVDWKTAARLSGQEEGDSPDEFILLDDQITSYCWALWLLGIPVAGFIHHEIKKAFPVPPEPNKTQRKGCWYSVNKQQATSYDLYLETISEGDPSGLASGAYDDFLDWLKAEGPRYYSRKQVHRSETELINAGVNIWKEALEITNPDLLIYPSPGRYACGFCAFRQPCLGENRNEDVEYMFLSNFEKRSPRYWEHNKPSTDSKGGQ